MIFCSSKHDIWNFKNPSTDSWDMTTDYIYGHHCISDFWSTCWRLTTIKCADLNRYTFSSMFSHEKVTLFKSEHFIGNLLYCNLKVKVLRDLVMFASAQLKCGQKILYTIAILLTIVQCSLFSNHTFLRFFLFFCNLTSHNNKLFFFKTNIDNKMEEVVIILAFLRPAFYGW